MKFIARILNLRSCSAVTYFIKSKRFIQVSKCAVCISDMLLLVLNVNGILKYLNKCVSKHKNIIFLY